MSNHFVYRIDSIWAAQQQAAYYSAFSQTPKALSSAVASSLATFLRLHHGFSMRPILVMYRVFTPPGRKRSPDSWHPSRCKALLLAEAEMYMGKSTGPGDPLVDDPKHAEKSTTSHFLSQKTWAPVGTAATGPNGLAPYRPTVTPMNSAPSTMPWIGSEGEGRSWPRPTFLTM